MIAGTAAIPYSPADPIVAMMKFEVHFHPFLWAGVVVLEDMMSAFLRGVDWAVLQHSEHLL